MELEKRLFEVAKHLFSKFGIRSVTMDDLSKELGVSKKTLYQFVKDKDDLVFRSLEMKLRDKRVCYENMRNQSKSTIEELHSVSQQFRRDMNEANPSMMFDLEKYYPSAWKEWLHFKNDFIKGNIKELLTQGVKEGVFRSEINPDIMATYRVEQIQMIFNEKIFSRQDYDFFEVQMSIFDHFVHGILTPKGKKLYNDCCK